MLLKRGFALLSLAILAMPLTGYGQIKLDIDPRIDQTKIDFDLWNRTVVPVHDSITMPYPLPQLKIEIINGNNSGAGCGIIYLSSNVLPQNKSDISDNFYRILTHEYSHNKFLCIPGNLNLLGEGLPESEKNKTYSLLHNIDSRITVTSDLFIGPSLDNMDLNYGGGGNFYGQSPLIYKSIAAKWDFLVNKLPGGNYTHFYQKLTEASSKKYSAENKRLLEVEETLEVLDATTNYTKVNGILPSTFFLNSPVSFLNGPDGTFLAVYASNNTGVNSKWFWVQMPINPSIFIILIKMRENGLDKYGSKGVSLRWEIKDPFGRVMLQESRTFDINDSMGFSLQGAPGWPEGTYKISVSGCVLAGSTCGSDSLRATNYFMVYNGDWENKMFVIANGPGFEDLSDGYRPNIVLPQGVNADWKPGYYVLTPNGQDISLTKSEYKRTYSGYPQMVTFTEPDRPYLYSITNGASFNTNGASLKINSVVPGSIATAFTWGATHTDPENAASLPLPQSSCKGGQGETSVVFVSNGNEYKTPLFYCSQQQINFQVPSGIAGGQAQVCTTLNGTRSNCLTVDVVEADPGIFVVDWKNMVGAVIFQDGGIVNSERPAQAGDVLSIYTTGLGTVDNPISDGHSASSSPLSNTLNTPTVIIDKMEFPVIFSGLAPGFVGLYQINFIVPKGLSPGNHKLTISTRNVVSNTVNLAIN